MSFGISVSDIFATTQLAYRTFTALRDAPSEFASLRLEVLSLHTTLKSLSEEAAPPSLGLCHSQNVGTPYALQPVSILTYCSDSKKEALRTLLSHCAKGLTQLEHLAKGCKSLGEGEKRRFIERIEFAARSKGGSGSQGPRERLALHTNCLNVFLTGLTHSTLGRLEGLWRHNMMPMMERVEVEFGGVRDLQLTHHQQVLTRLEQSKTHDADYLLSDEKDRTSSFYRRDGRNGSSKRGRGRGRKDGYNSTRASINETQPSFSTLWKELGASLLRSGIDKYDIAAFRDDIYTFIHDRVKLAETAKGCPPYVGEIDSSTGKQSGKPTSPYLGQLQSIPYRPLEHAEEAPQRHSPASTTPSLGTGASEDYKDKHSTANHIESPRGRNRRSTSAPAGENRTHGPTDGAKIKGPVPSTTTATAGLVVRHARSKSRDRNAQSRERKALPIATAGLASAAVAGLYEKTRARKAVGGSYSWSRNTSRSRSRSRSRPRSRAKRDRVPFADNEVFRRSRDYYGDYVKAEVPLNVEPPRMVGLADIIREEEARIEKVMRGAREEGEGQDGRVEDLVTLFESAFEVDDAVLVGEAAVGALD